MSCVLILRASDDSSQTYFESGTGWVSALGSATTYSTQYLAMADGVAQRDLLGPHVLLTVKNQSTGEEHPVPGLVPPTPTVAGL